MIQRVLLSVCLILFSFEVSLAATSCIEELKEKYPNKHFQFVDLASGRTHYQLGGPKNGRVVVLIHGVSGPLQAWDKNFDDLVNAGFRVLRYDLLGRGFSERVKGPYGLDLYIEQLEELLFHLGLSREELALVGSSMGAIVSSEFARRNPDFVSKLVLIGPAGFPIQVPFLARLGDVPVLGDILFFVAGRYVILQQNKKYFYLDKPRQEFMPFFSEQLRVRGTKEAMRDTMRKTPVQNYVKQYEEVGKLSIPTQIFWGTNDVTFPFENNRTLRKAIPHSSLVSIGSSAHLPQYEYPDVVNPTLIEFLKD